jgi:hypothetical protein
MRRCDALTDGERQEGGLMHPTDADRERDAEQAEHVDDVSAQQTSVRTLADAHAALALEFHALHEQASALQHQDKVSRAERWEQINALIRAEGEVLDRARRIRGLLQRRVSE